MQELSFPGELPTRPNWKRLPLNANRGEGIMVLREDSSSRLLMSSYHHQGRVLIISELGEEGARLW